MEVFVVLYVALGTALGVVALMFAIAAWTALLQDKDYGDEDDQ